MTQCAKIIAGFMANVGNVFYPTFTNVCLFSPRFFTFFTVFFNFHLNVYYINVRYLSTLRYHCRQSSRNTVGQYECQRGIRC